jgi:hypothetical protein
MRSTILILSLLLAPAAHADLSDSGNLSIGGNGVISGTMTVTGKDTGGYGLAVSSGIDASSGTIKALQILWADGTVSTTASTNGGSGGGSAWLGGGGLWISTASGVGGVIVESVDGAVQSSGCVVAMYWDSGRSMFVESSTTTDFASLSGVVSGVLYEDCTPGAECKVITHGLVRIHGNSGSNNSMAVTTSSTRCYSANNAQTLSHPACGNNTCTGQYIQCDGSSPYWCMAWMRGP